MVSVEHLALCPVQFTVNPLLSPQGAYLFQAHLAAGGGGVQMGFLYTFLPRVNNIDVFRKGIRKKIKNKNKNK